MVLPDRQEIIDHPENNWCEIYFIHWITALISSVTFCEAAGMSGAGILAKLSSQRLMRDSTTVFAIAGILNVIPLLILLYCFGDALKTTNWKRRHSETHRIYGDNGGDGVVYLGNEVVQYIHQYEEGNRNLFAVMRDTEVSLSKKMMLCISFSVMQLATTAAACTLHITNKDPRDLATFLPVLQLFLGLCALGLPVAIYYGRKKCPSWLQRRNQIMPADLAERHPDVTVGVPIDPTINFAGNNLPNNLPIAIITIPIDNGIPATGVPVLVPHAPYPSI